MKEDKRLFLSTPRIITLLLLALSYALVREFSFQEAPVAFLLFRVLFWTGVIALISSDIAPELKVPSRKRLFIFIFWLFVVLSLPLSPSIQPEIPASIILFISYVPLTFLLKFTTSSLLRITFILLLVLTAVFCNINRPMAEMFAGLTYLWLATSFIIALLDFLKVQHVSRPDTSSPVHKESEL